MEPTTLTKNGAPAFATTYSSLLDLFGQLNRSLEPTKLADLLAACWLESPTRTLQLVAYTRDIRHGVGERRLFYYMAAWLAVHAPQAYIANLPMFLEQGYYRDLLHLMNVKTVLHLGIATEVILLTTDLLEHKGLAAKWAPSEGGRFDDYAKECMRAMGMRPREYRKFLTTERARLHVLETYLCAQAYADISFKSIPSQAMLKYSNAFLRTCNAKKIESGSRKELKERYLKYLEDVKAGKAKINSGTLMPHQLVANPTSPTADTLWSDLVAKHSAKASGYLSESMAIVDVSGSMSTQVAPGVSAMYVAVALGLLITEVSKVADRQMITFSAQPTFVTVPTGTLDKKVKDVQRSMPWGMNTNFHAVMSLLLHNRRDVKRLFVFSDMQFDAAGTWNQSLHQQLAEEWRAAGRTLPEIVYWNLCAKGALPVSATQHGVALVSGFSSKLIELFLDDRPLHPLSVMLETLNRYTVTPTVVEVATPSTIDWDAVTKAVTHP